MKVLVSSVVCILLVSTCALGQGKNDALSLFTSSKSGASAPPEGGDSLCETLDDLIVGPLEGQVGAAGVLWGSFDGTVVDAGGGDLQANQINTFVDDGFFPEMTAFTADSFVPQASDGFSVTVDYELSDLNTQRYYTPVGEGQDDGSGAIFRVFFTRLGDATGNQNWDVLEVDAFGTGFFVDTGVAIELSGSIEFVINGLDMQIFVNGSMIYDGVIIGANGDLPTPTGSVGAPSALDEVFFESANNIAGGGSEQNINNLAINDPGCGGGMKGCTNPLGDVNLDGKVNLEDVDPFVAALSVGSTQCEADIDGDGLVTLEDVDPFVVLLAGGGG